MRIHLLTPEDVAEALQVGRTKVFELMANDELRSVRVGRLRRIPPAALEEYIQRLEGAGRTPKRKGGAA